MPPRPRHLIEYSSLRAIQGLACILPERFAIAIGWLLAIALYCASRRRVSEAKRRLREVFGAELTASRLRQIAWRSLRNTCFNAIEVMRMSRVTPQWIASHLQDGGLMQRLAERAQGQGAILVVPHMGNWDLAGVAAQQLGAPIFFIVGHQKNPLVDAWLNRMRGVTGIETIPRDSSVLKKVIRNLRDGKVLAFMTDLRSRTPGVKVQFLGKEANLVAGMGLFARQAGVPIYPALMYREGWTRHRWVIGPTIHPDSTLSKEDDGQRMTQRVMAFYEAAIRKDPDQYFWYNKRWVLDPLESPASGAAG